jgi:hypothetical protein
MRSFGSGAFGSLMRRGYLAVCLVLICDGGIRCAAGAFKPAAVACRNQDHAAKLAKVPELFPPRD